MGQRESLEGEFYGVVAVTVLRPVGRFRTRALETLLRNHFRHPSPPITCHFYYLSAILFEDRSLSLQADLLSIRLDRQQNNPSRILVTVSSNLST